MKTKQSFSTIKFVLLLAFTLATIISCRKSDLVLLPDKQNENLVIQRFFNLNNINDTEIKHLADNIRQQDSIFKFLPAFIEKNGLPKWDKTIYKTETYTNISKVQEQLMTLSTASAFKATNTTSSSSKNQKGVFFIPLQENNSTTIKSYIVAYKHSDSVYSYRVYNRDSLNAIQPSSWQTKKNLLNLQAVFGYFEKSINNIDFIDIKVPENTVITQATLSFDNSLPIAATNSITSKNNVIFSECSSTMIVTIDYHYTNEFGFTETVSHDLEIEIDCTGGYSNNWWNYGTGWPWNTYENNHPNNANPYQYDPYHSDFGWWWDNDEYDGSSTNVYDPGENFEFTIVSDPAIDLAKYFKCFDNIPDAGATYTVKLCADLPSNNNPDNLINNSLEPGHSFITMTKTNGNNSVTQSFGFYPVPKYVSALMIPVSSKIVDNGSSGNEHEYNASIEAKNISQQDFKSLQNIALSRANLMKYDLNDYNCTTYALDVFNFINQSNPVVVPDWLGSGGNTPGGFNYKKTPNGLYKALNAMTNNPNVSVGKFQASTSHGPCN